MCPILVGLERSQAAASLGISAAGGVGLWLILVAVLALATRTKDPEPQPAGLELGGDEPPAVVNLLASGWKVRGEAMSSTLVDLAARHVIEFERRTDGRLMVRLGKNAADLTPYELPRGQSADAGRCESSHCCNAGAGAAPT